MITYKVKTLFTPEWQNLFSAMFPGKEHDASSINGSVATFTFLDSTIVPIDLSPLVQIEIVPTVVSAVVMNEIIPGELPPDEPPPGELPPE